MARGHPAAGHRDGLRRVEPESKYFAIDVGVHPLRQCEIYIFCYLRMLLRAGHGIRPSGLCPASPRVGGGGQQPLLLSPSIAGIAPGIAAGPAAAAKSCW